ncbi:alpha/beta fold hydrolase [Actinomadura soli]|uniref:Alpha/beta fold hydrolase n=1 Tax=Actinomadura soli TaxID=2508997 RepID=A0A5C4JD41_9ACTN|nr:alpha/beta fold hydrolase [Actinomadura soli]TMR01090.1 alpha/beta fold hydrolase [Actinomadura soli]
MSDEPVTYVRTGPAGAPAVVCLHGIGSNADAFRGVLDLLAPAYQGIAPNAPGYGGSAPLPAARPTVTDYATALVAFLDRLGLPSWHLVGSSMGALIAAAIAAAHPDRVESLLLTAPATGAGRTPQTRQAELTARADLIALGPERMAETRAPQLIAGNAPGPLRAVKEATRALDPAAYMQAAHALASGDLLTCTPHIRARTLVVCGTADKVAPPDDHARPISDAIPGSELILLPDLGHVIELESPGELAALITRHAGAS